MLDYILRKMYCFRLQKSAHFLFKNNILEVLNKDNFISLILMILYYDASNLSLIFEKSTVIYKKRLSKLP